MAKWKPFDLKWGRSIWYCSACEESTEVPTYLGTPMYNFCPMCGANMNMKKADGCKTENCSEIPNNSKVSEKPTGSTISKMEQVDKDINVRSKDEPQWTKENCKGCKYNEYPYDSGTCFVRVCINGNKYEPKDEPQTEREGE